MSFIYGDYRYWLLNNYEFMWCLIATERRYVSSMTITGRRAYCRR